MNRIKLKRVLTKLLLPKINRNFSKWYQQNIKNSTHSSSTEISRTWKTAIALMFKLIYIKIVLTFQKIEHNISR